MAAITIDYPNVNSDGLHPFEARRHLRQVAELIGAVFADELDAAGRSTLSEMQTVSRLSPVLGGMMSSTLFREFVLGFVWLENGRVVGNVTLQQADTAEDRWRISNVAVRPEYRQRGIARRLMEATLAHAAQRGGRWAILQVRKDNVPARELYGGLGFTDVCLDGLWRLPWPRRPRSEPDGDGSLVTLSALNWRARFELAKAAQTPLARWNESVQLEEYQMGPWRLVEEAFGSWSGLRTIHRWGKWQGSRLLGAVESVASTGSSSHILRLAVHPEARGTLEEHLIARGLNDLVESPARSVVIRHNGDHAEGVAALEAAGFRPERVLLTMRRRLDPEDTLS